MVVTHQALKGALPVITVESLYKRGNGGLEKGIVWDQPDHARCWVSNSTYLAGKPSPFPCF